MLNLSGALIVYSPFPCPEPGVYRLQIIHHTPADVKNGDAEKQRKNREIIVKNREKCYSIRVYIVYREAPMSGYVVLGESESRTEVKKSVFIATVREIHSEEEAVSFIEAMRKKYWDARHNCYAYILGERSEIRRFSDDKEPQGTAGKPILEAISSAGFLNTAVVVTRYFGGILLGTGGLVRAYSQAASLGLKESSHFPVAEGDLLRIGCGYAEVSKLQYLLRSLEIPLLDSDYAEAVTFTAASEKAETEGLIKKITEAANGAASVTVLDSVYFLKDGAQARIYRF